MKRTISILLTSIFLTGCFNNITIDCAKTVNGNLISEFNVRNVYLRDKRFSRYLLNEEKYNDKLIELQEKQIGDTLLVKFFKLGGNPTTNCVEIDKSNNRIDIINYQSNFLKEVAIQEFEYRIQNLTKLKLGKVEFVALEK